ncbi:hypothetical protein ASPCADRAFT_625 [Aspergillus carbonarius ITEM 5010]|uniref:Uncharacterized protein n=1 Tax=Aspergillus carbonarius (strain ITEM 5010) TaxID=602072 RepID=A0A1R3S275_ASPC5|nr:hypothetical protein ASPCADRAFT_625 [Aspergillus carbonarius ITEM 5010]
MTSTNHTVYIWPSEEPGDWAPGYPKCWGQAKANIKLAGQSTAPAISPDNQFIAVGVGRAIQIFDAGTQELIESFEGHRGDVKEVRFAPPLANNHKPGDARYVLVSDGDWLYGSKHRESTNDNKSPEEGEIAGSVVLWDLGKIGKLEGEPLDAKTLTDQTLKPLIANLTTDHGWENSEQAIIDLKIRVRRAMNKEVHRHIYEPQIGLRGTLHMRGELTTFGSPIFSSDGQTMIYLSQNKMNDQSPRKGTLSPCVNLWNVRSRSLRYQLHGHTDTIEWAGMSPDSELAASVARDGTARVWNAESGQCLHIMKPQGGRISWGAFSPNSKYLAFHQENLERLVWQRLRQREAEQESTLSSESLRTGGCSKGWKSSKTKNKPLNPDTYIHIYELVLSGDPITRVQFVDNGRMLMVQVQRGTVVVYNLQLKLKKMVRVFLCNPSPIMSMVVSDDSRLLVISHNEDLELWDL